MDYYKLITKEALKFEDGVYDDYSIELKDETIKFDAISVKRFEEFLEASFTNPAEYSVVGYIEILNPRVADENGVETELKEFVIQR